MADIRRDDPDFSKREGARNPGYRRSGLAVLKRISWGAVFAGLVVALVVQFILSLLGIGIGMGMIDPLEEQNPLSGLGTGALIWWVVTILIALFTGGYVSGRLAGMPRTPDSVLHGLLTFSLFTLVSTYIITSSVGSVLGGVGGLVGQTLSMAGEGVASVVSEGTGEVDSGALQKIKNEAMTLLSQAGVSREELDRTQKQIEEDAKKTGTDILINPQSAGREIEDLIERTFSKTDSMISQVDQEALVDIVVKRTGKSREEANQIVDNWINTFQDLKRESSQLARRAEQKTREVSDSVASAISQAAIFLFIGLVLGAGAAAVGGKVGEPHDIVETEHDRDIR